MGGNTKLERVPEGVRRQWAADRALRPPMRSPGRPEPSRGVQREFWRLIATGVTTVEAALHVGVSWPVGARWFRHAGGMPPAWTNPPAAICHLPNARRSRCCGRKARACGKSAAASDAMRGRSRVSCGVTPRHAAANRNIGPRWRSGRRSRRPTPEDSQAGVESAAARIRPEALERQRPPTRWHGRRRAQTACVEGTEQAAPAGPAVGDGLEPGADRPPSQDRLPRG